MLQRADKLRSKMAKKGISAAVITSRESRFYLSGFTGSAGILLIDGDGAVLFTDSRYELQAREEARGFNVEITGSPMGRVNEELLKFRGARVGFEDEDVTHKLYTKLTAGAQCEFVPISYDLLEMRQVKSETEKKAIRQAVAISDGAFSYITQKLAPGMSEIQIAADIEGFMRRAGASKTSFDTIVASGARSAMVHGGAGQRQVEPGDFVIMDFGCIFEGYCSDLTRTVVISHTTKEQREIYSLVRCAQERAISSVLPYMAAKDLDFVARDVFEKAQKASFFGHGLGHGVGINVHEKPSISPISEDELLPGSVITIEPGLYIEGFGGVRIEDMVIVGEGECEVLTKAAKELIVI